jgi:hypothetical protein
MRGSPLTAKPLASQDAQLHAAGCAKVYGEKVSGAKTDRAKLAKLLKRLEPGGALMVTRLDRLARSIADLQDIVRTLKARGAALRATEQPIDTSTAAGKCFLDMLQRVPLEVNRRVGKGALCAPCPPLATDRVGTARAIKLACHSNDWSARAFAHPTNVIQFHRDLL